MLVRFCVRLIVRLDAPFLQLLHVLPVLNVRMSVVVAVEVVFIVMTVMIRGDRHWHRYVMMVMSNLKWKRRRRYKVGATRRRIRKRTSVKNITYLVMMMV